MKISYNRNEDIMILEVSPGAIDYAEEMGPIIVHFTKEGKPVLLEILDASDFIADIARTTIKAKNSELLEVTT